MTSNQDWYIAHNNTRDYSSRVLSINVIVRTPFIPTTIMNGILDQYIPRQVFLCMVTDLAINN